MRRSRRLGAFASQLRLAKSVSASGHSALALTARLAAMTRRAASSLASPAATFATAVAVTGMRGPGMAATAFVTASLVAAAVVSLAAVHAAFARRAVTAAATGGSEERDRRNIPCRLVVTRAALIAPVRGLAMSSRIVTTRGPTFAAVAALAAVTGVPVCRGAHVAIRLARGAGRVSTRVLAVRVFAIASNRTLAAWLVRPATVAPVRGWRAIARPFVPLTRADVALATRFLRAAMPAASAAAPVLAAPL